jgi:hypothetical protein
LRKGNLATLCLVLVCFVAACALRVPATPRHLCYEDSINFAQAVEHYDPRHLVPQPPGYPLFVLQAKVLTAIFGSVERGFLAGVILGTAIAFFTLILLTHEMTGGRTEAVAAVALLAVNPVFLFTGFTSPIRVYLAAVALMVALACWRAWNGDRRSAWIGAVALGLGSGYRPELLLLLFPLWAWSAWRALRSPRSMALATLLLAGVSALWIGFLLSRFPSLAALIETFRQYITNQSRDLSPVFGASTIGWKRILLRTAIWNGTAIAGWAVLAPLARPRLRAGVWTFVAVWIVPSLIFHAVIHLDDPDQALSTIPAFCLLGGAFLASFVERNRDVGLIGVGFVVVFNLVAFLAPFPLRPAREWYTPVVEALWHTSYSRHDSVQQLADTLPAALAPELRNSPTLVIWNRSPLTWRTLSYYFPDQTFCLLLDDPSTGNRPHAALWRHLQLQERIFGDPPAIPLSDARQIVWVLGPWSPVRAAAAYRLEQRAEGLYRSPATPMELPGYRIVQ